MGLWLLSFTQREVAVIVEAKTLAHALGCSQRRTKFAEHHCSMRALPLSPVFMRRFRQISLGERFRKMKPLICSAC
jgi:hypothetical protein